MAGGRPTRYKKEYAEQAYKYCLLGADDQRLASFFDVCIATIHNWKNNHPEFLDALKRGKDLADAEVADSLFKRATGYSHVEQKVFNNQGEIDTHDTVKHYPPDPTAIAYWLNNRQRKNWKMRQDINHESEDGTMSPDTMTPEQRKARIKELIAKGERDAE